MNKLKIPLIIYFLFLPMIFTCANGSDKNETFRGKLGQPCYLDGTCDDPLECINEVCKQPTATSYCGNGVKEESEECDQNAFGASSTLCSDYGFLDGRVICSDICRLDFSKCVVSLTCGNNVKENAEQCDGSDFGNDTSLDCTDYGYLAGDILCNDNCTLDYSGCQAEPICGNSVIEGNEECEGNNLGGDSSNCADHGYKDDGNVVTCDSNCHLDYSACTLLPSCNNGVKEGVEECDGNDFGGNTPLCSDYAFYSGNISCSSTCTISTASCSGYCGDGVIQATYEECDVTLGGTICNSIGYINGNLSCNNSTCSFNTASCNSFKQWGTTEDDDVASTYTDSSGNTYVAGNTAGNLFAPNIGGKDFYVIKYSSDGNQIWALQYGDTGDDIVFDLALDSSGNIYVVGATTSNLEGNTNLGGYDAFILKISPSGSVVSVKQYGTDQSEFALTLTIVGNYIYVAGGTYGTMGAPNTGNCDLLISKIDTNLNILWHYQEETTNYDLIWKLASNGSVLFAGGVISATSPYINGDGFIGSYSLTDGHQLWRNTLSTQSGIEDAILSVGYDSNYIYGIGYTAGTFAGNNAFGSWDYFVVKYNTSGSQSWLKQYGTSALDTGEALNFNNGFLYVVGRTQGTIGSQSFGSTDVFINKINSSSGAILSSYQYGTIGDDSVVLNLDVDTNSLYTGGNTTGAFPLYSNAGGLDAYYIKIPISDIE